jgi:hypothetical protein
MAESQKTQDPAKVQGQADKARAEARTAQVAAENEQQQEQNEGQTVVSPDQTPERADGAPAQEGELDSTVNPYPDYDSQKTDELASLAESRGVEINRDVEKAQLIKQLRDSDSKAESTPSGVEGASNRYASYDVMPLEQLRSLAQERDVELDEEFKRAHLVTELHAADTSGGVSIPVKQ